MGGTECPGAEQPKENVSNVWWDGIFLRFASGFLCRAKYWHAKGRCNCLEPNYDWAQLEALCQHRICFLVKTLYELLHTIEACISANKHPKAYCFLQHVYIHLPCTRYPDGHMVKVIGPINDMRAESESVLEHTGITWQVSVPAVEKMIGSINDVSDYSDPVLEHTDTTWQMSMPAVGKVIDSINDVRAESESVLEHTGIMWQVSVPAFEKVIGSINDVRD